MNNNRPNKDQEKKRFKTINDDIRTKTQMALEVIQKFQARKFKEQRKNSEEESTSKQEKVQQNKFGVYQSLQINKPLWMQIFSYGQKNLLINLSNLNFPIRIFLKNVCHSGILYVGYNKRHSEIEQNQYSSTIQEQEERPFQFKFQFHNDQMISLKKHPNKQVQNLLLTFKANTQQLIFNVKFDSIWYQGRKQTPKNRRKKILTEVKTQEEENGFETNHTKRGLLPQLRETSKTKIYSKSKNQIFADLKRSNTEKINNVGAFFEEEKKKDFSKVNLLNIANFQREKQKSFKAQKLVKAKEIAEKVKINREQINEFREKQLEVRIKATNFKRLISQYEKNYKYNENNKEKILKQLSPLIFGTIFARICSTLYEKQTRMLNSVFTVEIKVNNLTSNLRQKNKKMNELVPTLDNRQKLTTFHFLQSEAKIIQIHSFEQASKHLWEMFTEIKHGILINSALYQGANFRRSVRIIQRNWLTKYQNRLKMLYLFADGHVEATMKQFPYLKLGLSNYKKGNHRHQLCYAYIADESQKFRLIYVTHRKKVQQLQDFKEENKKIRQQNKKKPENKQKKQLVISQPPLFPQHRIFRNLDILKSMIRGWFELQYKKIFKKNMSTFDK